MNEIELAEKFIAYFGGYEIYQEVPALGIIDFVAVAGNIRTAVEVKTTFNWKVFEQAVRNKNYAHYSYVAVPHNKDAHFRERLCKDYGIGLLYFSPKPEWVKNIEDYNFISEAVAPRINRSIAKVKLREYMKDSVAGSQNQRITAFGNTINAFKIFLQRNGGKVSIKRVIEDVAHHYGSNTSAKQCIINLCRSGVIKDFNYEDGFLILNRL